MKPITTVEELIARFESSSLDYKTTYDHTTRATRYEVAKDVAAFANAYGGSIVVGVVEAGGKVVRVPGAGDVAMLTAQVATALQQYCAPIPSTPEEHAITLTPADAERLLAASGARAPATDVVLVTLNVRPDTRAPIAVRLYDSAANAPLAGAYRFPVRIDDQTRFLDPTELPMWMNSHERRIAIQVHEVLSQAPKAGLQVRVFDVDEQRTMASPSPIISYVNGSHLLWVRGLEEQSQTLLLSTDDSPSAFEIRVPLSFVSAIWREPTDGMWSVAIRGCVRPTHGVRFQPHAV